MSLTTPKAGAAAEDIQLNIDGRNYAYNRDRDDPRSWYRVSG
jgi:hypothetical protein